MNNTPPASKKSRLRLLGADGVPLAPTPAAEATTEPQAAPIALQTLVQSLEDGPLKVRFQAEFDDIKIGGNTEPLLRAMRMVLTANGVLSLRLLSLMIVGLQTRTPTSTLVQEALGMLDAMRLTAESMMERMARGLDPVPVIETAGPESVPPAAGG